MKSLDHILADSFQFRSFTINSKAYARVVPKVCRQLQPCIFQWKLIAEKYFMIYFNEYMYLENAKYQHRNIEKKKKHFL